MPGKYYDVSTRAQALALKAYGASNAEILAATGIQKTTLSQIFDRAIERGFTPGGPILDQYVADAPKPGRPRKQDAVHDDVLAKVRTDRYGREKTCQYIAQEIGGVSPMTVWRVLRASGLRKTKPTRKPGLTDEMRQARLQWCLDHKDWTLDQLKKVIWTDETSVVLNHRRGGYKVWRSSDEAFVKSVIRPRWKGYCEFMFWGAFSYDHKGPCHVWKPETAKDKKAAEKDLVVWNAQLEPVLQDEWELNTPMQRLGLRNRPGRKPEWKFTKANGKLVREAKKGGIDWYRYQKEVVVPKLIPFAKKVGPDSIVQEDKALSHAHSAVGLVYAAAEIERLL
jgi:transposase